MKKIVLTLTIVSIATVGLIAISDADGDLPPADAEKLWLYMTTEDPYTGWGLRPGHVASIQERAPTGPT